jgi:hypothetical protein
MVKGKASGPEWFLGGSYGLEGGMLGTLVILLGLIYVLLYVKPTPGAIPGEVAEALPKGIQRNSGV